jgi:predicted ester cyclase
MSTDHSPETNKSTVRRLYEFINGNRAEQFALVVAPRYVDHSNGQQGPSGFAEAAANLHRAYADLRLEIADMVAEGDLVAVRWVETGRHVGQFFSLKPTGKRFESRGMNLYRVRDGKILESWLAIDPVTIRAQRETQQAPAEAGSDWGA